MAQRMTLALLAVLAVTGLSLALIASGFDGQKEEKKEEKVIELESGLKYVVLKKGLGDDKAEPGDLATVHYTGWLAINGKKFDSSVDRKEPFAFTLGRREVIAGWDQGVAGMQLGEKRKLMIPAKLGYGERGAGRDIPPNMDLIFEVELLRLRKAP